MVVNLTSEEIVEISVENEFIGTNRILNLGSLQILLTQEQEELLERFYSNEEV